MLALDVAQLPATDPLMCRLFGFRSAVVSRAHRSLIAANNALAEQARAHPHGWGIGYFHHGDAYVLKSEQAAAESETFRRAADQVASNALIAHVRRATVGDVTPLNVHPFRHARWVFAHNGTLFGFDNLRARMMAEIPSSMARCILGTTDTEVLFHFLLAYMKRAGIDDEGLSAVDAVQLADVLHVAVARVAELARAVGADAPIMNFILTNGRVFVGNRRGRELFFATQKVICRDSLTCQEPQKPCLLNVRPHERVNHLIVASERIGDEDIWEEVPEGCMAVLSEDFRLQIRAA